MKKFWKFVTLESIKAPKEGFRVLLDGSKPLKTPGGSPLFIPASQPILASLVAGEWETINTLKSYSVPLTAIVARASDFEQVEERNLTIEKLLRYVDTDSVCYLQPYPESFEKMQSEYWTTLVKWLKTEHDLDIKTTNGILPVSQSQKTLDFFKQKFHDCDGISLAAFEKTIMMTKSVIIPFAVFSKKLQVDVAVTTARLEVLHQIDRWGQVEDSHDTDYQDFKRVLGAASIAWLKS